MWENAQELFSFLAAWKHARFKARSRRNSAKPKAKAWAKAYARIYNKRPDLMSARREKEKLRWENDPEWKAKKQARTKAYRERAEIKKKQSAYMKQWKVRRDADPIKKEKARVTEKARYATGERKAKNREWRERNVSHRKEKGRAWRLEQIAKDPLYERKSALRKKYGITIDDWNARFERQGHKCACCDRPFAGESLNVWHLDHDHVTDEIRGILCHFCNNTLGRLGDNEEGVIAGCDRFLKYLRRGRGS